MPDHLFTPAANAIAQLDDPAFLRVVAASIGWTLAGFAAVTFAIFWGAQHLLGSDPGHGWYGWLASLLGGLGVIVAAIYLFLPVAAVVGTLFVNPVADAVERRHYPGLPAPHPATLSAQLWDGIALGLRVLVYQLLGLGLGILLPGIGAVIGWIVAAWSLGRGLFVAVAMRRMDRASALRCYAQRRTAVVAQGGLMALAGVVPLLHLVVPVLGTAAMAHLLIRGGPPQ